ncbi:MAG: hypothetical protein ABSE73_18935 [Planctomycetota bacterium]
MPGKFITATLLAVVLSLCCAQAVRADGTATTTTTPSTTTHRHHHHPIQFILNHAAQLNLTAAQITALKALQAKIEQHHAQNQSSKTSTTSTTGQTTQHHHWLREQIEKILTAAQMEKLRALVKQAHQNKTGT